MEAGRGAKAARSRRVHIWEGSGRGVKIHRGAVSPGRKPVQCQALGYPHRPRVSKCCVTLDRTPAGANRSRTGQFQIRCCNQARLQTGPCHVPKPRPSAELTEHLRFQGRRLRSLVPNSTAQGQRGVVSATDSNVQAKSHTCTRQGNEVER